MKRLLLVVLMFLNLTGIGWAGDSIELEQAYKQEHDELTADISRYKYQMTHSDEEIAKDPVYSRITDEKTRSQFSFALMNNGLKMMSKTIEKKKELKLRILEKLGKLPSWWEID